MIDALAWIATAAILVTYWLAARRPRRLPWFHTANALGCLAVGASAVEHSAYPSLALTASGVNGTTITAEVEVDAWWGPDEFWVIGEQT